MRSSPLLARIVVPFFVDSAARLPKLNPSITLINPIGLDLRSAILSKMTYLEKTAV